MNVRNGGRGSYCFRSCFRSYGHLVIFSAMHFCGIRKLGEAVIDGILHCDMVQVAGLTLTLNGLEHGLVRGDPYAFADDTWSLYFSDEATRDAAWELHEDLWGEDVVDAGFGGRVQRCGLDDRPVLRIDGRLGIGFNVCRSAGSEESSGAENKNGCGCAM